MKKLMYFVLMGIAVAGCKKNDHSSRSKADIVYVETNDFADGKNAILAYRNNNDGTMAAIAGSPFSTGGAGVGNPEQILGPDDSETQLKLSDDKKFLLAVNSGSNTIAVFHVQQDGSLAPVDGSPFPSGGENPVSIDIKGKYVFVVNKSQDPLHPSVMNPNYATFTLDGNGKLTAVAGALFETTAGVSPAQALLSNKGNLLFGADFLGFMQTPAVGTLRSFTVDGDGKLQPVSGTPYTIPGMGGALGLWQHPKADILYVGFPVQGKVGVYAIDNASGALTFQSTLEAGPASCWIRTSANGDYLYALNSGENSISMWNSSNASSPSSLGKLALKQSGPGYMAMGMTFATSQAFSFELSPKGRYMYVVSQHTNPDFNIGNFNYFHTLAIGDDGRLTEPTDPMQLPVDARVRPQGVAVLEVDYYKNNNDK